MYVIEIGIEWIFFFNMALLFCGLDVNEVYVVMVEDKYRLSVGILWKNV